MAQSQYRFERAFPESPGFGPALAVMLRATDELLGYVRRIDQPSARGHNWKVYDGYGEEVAVSDLRSTAANFLRARVERKNLPA